jgi:hypothetical protein
MNTGAARHDQGLQQRESARVPDQPPFCVRTALRCWVDLAATIRAFPLLSAVAGLACAATSLSNADLAAFEDPSVTTVSRALGMAVIEAFVTTPLLLAAHRLVILADTTSSPTTLVTRRFWRFFLLTAGILALLYMPVLLARWARATDAATMAVTVLGVIGSGATGLLLSLLFPAIAVDAPGATIRNAVADLWGKVFSIFCSGLLAFLPVAVAALIMGRIQDTLVEDADGLRARLTAAPFDGLMTVTTYVLLVLVASHYFLARANRLAQPGETAG